MGALDSRDRAALTRTLQAIYREIGAMGDRVYQRVLPGGRLLPRNGGTGTTQGAEPPLCNPASDGDALVSTTAGVRSWVAKQDQDADLTAIAGLSPANDDVLQRKAGAWTNRTLAQLIADLIAVGAWTEAVQDVIGAMVAAAGGSYDDTAGTITLPGGGGSALAVEEADGSPTDSAVVKLVVPNGWLSIASHVATLAPRLDTIPAPITDVSMAGHWLRDVADPSLAQDAATKAYVDNSFVGGAGAPGSAKYITAEPVAGLSAEIAIPGLAGSADIAGAAGAGFAEEYDSGSSGLTWTASAPATEDVNTTVISHLYMKCTDTAERIGYKSWSPSGDFDMRIKLATGTDTSGNCAMGIFALDSTNANRLMLQWQSGSGGQVAAYTYSGGSYALVGSALTVGPLADLYLRIVRTGGGNVIRYYVSRNGLTWSFVATVTFAITVARRGLRLESAGVPTHFIADWWRADV